MRTKVETVGDTYSGVLHPRLSLKDLLTHLFYFPTSTAKTPNTFVTVSLDSPVLHVDTLGILLWELCLQLVGEVMKNAHTVLCGLWREHEYCSYSY